MSDNTESMYHTWLRSLSDEDLKKELELTQGLMDERYGLSTEVQLILPEEKSEFTQILEEQLDIDFSVNTCWLCDKEYKEKPFYTWSFSVKTFLSPLVDTLYLCETCLADGAEDVGIYLGQRSVLKRLDASLYQAVGSAILRQARGGSLQWPAIQRQES